MTKREARINILVDGLAHEACERNFPSMEYWNKEGDGFELARLLGWFKRPVWGCSSLEEKTNARLIAAAPEMRAFLEKIVTVTCEHKVCSELRVHEARVLLAKMGRK